MDHSWCKWAVGRNRSVRLPLSTRFHYSHLNPALRPWTFSRDSRVLEVLNLMNLSKPPPTNSQFKYAKNSIRSNPRALATSTRTHNRTSSDRLSVSFARVGSRKGCFKNSPINLGCRQTPQTCITPTEVYWKGVSVASTATNTSYWVCA